MPLPNRKRKDGANSVFVLPPIETLDPDRLKMFTKEELATYLRQYEIDAGETKPDLKRQLRLLISTVKSGSVPKREHLDTSLSSHQHNHSHHTLQSNTMSIMDNISSSNPVSSMIPKTMPNYGNNPMSSSSNRMSMVGNPSHLPSPFSNMINPSSSNTNNGILQPTPNSEYYYHHHYHPNTTHQNPPSPYIQSSNSAQFGSMINNNLASGSPSLSGMNTSGGHLPSGGFPSNSTSANDMTVGSNTSLTRYGIADSTSSSHMGHLEMNPSQNPLTSRNNMINNTTHSFNSPSSTSSITPSNPYITSTIPSTSNQSMPTSTNALLSHNSTVHGKTLTNSESVNQFGLSNGSLTPSNHSNDSSIHRFPSTIFPLKGSELKKNQIPSSSTMTMDLGKEDYIAKRLLGYTPNLSPLQWVTPSFIPTQDLNKFIPSISTIHDSVINHENKKQLMPLEASISTLYEDALADRVPNTEENASNKSNTESLSMANFTLDDLTCVGCGKRANKECKFKRCKNCCNAVLLKCPVHARNLILQPGQVLFDSSPTSLHSTDSNIGETSASNKMSVLPPRVPRPSQPQAPAQSLQLVLNQPENQDPLVVLRSKGKRRFEQNQEAMEKIWQKSRDSTNFSHLDQQSRQEDGIIWQEILEKMVPIKQELKQEFEFWTDLLDQYHHHHFIKQQYDTKSMEEDSHDSEHDINREVRNNSFELPILVKRTPFQERFYKCKRVQYPMPDQELKTIKSL